MNTAYSLLPQNLLETNLQIKYVLVNCSISYIQTSRAIIYLNPCVWFLNYSTWTGTHGIYLEDLYVDENSRNKGFGLTLLSELAKVCVSRGYKRLQWSCLGNLLLLYPSLRTILYITPPAAQKIVYRRMLCFVNWILEWERIGLEGPL